MAENMVSTKLTLISEKIKLVLDRLHSLESERENLLRRIDVLEEELKIQKKSTESVEKQHEAVQQKEQVKPMTLFDSISNEELKIKIDGFIEEIDQCIEIIENK